MKREVAQKVLTENRSSYDKIAQEFSRTRIQFWNELVFLKEHTTSGMSLIDIGCGNGRFYSVIKERGSTYTGVDNSQGLLDEARKKFPEANFVNGDATALPFANESFNIAYSFATIHHIPSRALRKKFVSEAGRVLHTGNTFILTTWYLWRPRYISQLLFTAIKSLLLLSPLDIGDMMHTFGKERTPRYLHAFTERELLRLLKKNGFEIIGSEIISRGSGSGEKNILVVARKVK